MLEHMKKAKYLHLGPKHRWCSKKEKKKTIIEKKCVNETTRTKYMLERMKRAKYLQHSLNRGCSKNKKKPML